MASASRDKTKKVSVSGPSLIPAGELAGRPAIALTRPIIVAGSRNNCRLHLISRTVSKAHALIVVTRHTVFIRDLASREGTFVNGEKVSEQDLADGDILKIGRFEFIFATGGARLKPHREKQPAPAVIRQVNSDLPPVPLETRVVLVGRRGSADIAFTEQSVSAAHAVIVAWEGKRYVRDLGSRTGTFVNGKQVHQQEISPSDQIRVGDSELVYETSTPGEGVEVVASPTESAVATAIAAQEIESISLNADDTATPAEKPRVAAPAARPVRSSTPVRLEDSVADEPVEQAAPVALRAAGTPSEPIAQSEPVTVSGTPLGDSISEIEIDDVLGIAPGVGDETLSRRGWHRGTAEDEAGEGSTAAPHAGAPLTPFDFPPAAELTAAETSAAESTMDALTDLQLLPLDEEATVPPETHVPEVEVLERSDADTAQPLETVAPSLSDDAIEDALGVSDAMTDTVFTREVKALTDTNVGEPVEVDGFAEVSPPPATSPSLADADIHATIALPPPDDAIIEEKAGTAPVELAPLLIDDIAGASSAESSAQQQVTEFVPAIELRSPVTPVADLSPAEPIELHDVIDSAPDGLADADEFLSAFEPPAVPLTAPFVSPLDSVEELAAAVEREATIAAVMSEPSLDLPEPPQRESAPEPDTLAIVALDAPAAAEPIAELPLSEPALEMSGDEPESSPLFGIEEVYSTLAPPPEVADDAANGASGELARAGDLDQHLPAVEQSLALGESEIGDVLSGHDEPAVDRPLDQLDRDLSLPAAPVPEAAANEPMSLDDFVAPESVQTAPGVDSVVVDSAVGELSLDESNDAGEPLLDELPEAPLTSTEAARETAFSLVVPPLQISPEVSPEISELSPSDETAVSVVMPAELELPLPAGGTFGAEPSVVPESVIAEAVSPEPPPLPLNAPSVTGAGENEEVPGIVIAPKPRRPTVIKDGFNRRGRRGNKADRDHSPFAAGNAAIAMSDPFGSAPPADAFSTSSPLVDEASLGDKALDDGVLGDGVLGDGALAEQIAPPSEIAVPGTEVTAVATGELGSTVAAPQSFPSRRARDLRRADPLSLRRDRPLPSFGPDVTIPTARVAQPGGEASGDLGGGPTDLHELRRRRLKFIPGLLVAAFLLMGGAMGAIWQLFPVYTDFETAIKFGNFDALTIKEQRDLQDEQLRLLRVDITRRNAIKQLHDKNPEVNNGFLGNTVAFDKAVMLSGWPEMRKGDFVIRYRGSDPNDRHRVQALAATIYASNNTRIDNVTRVRSALRDAQDKLDSNNRKLIDLKSQIEKERVLGESRPKPGQIEEMQSIVLESEKQWTDAIAKLKEAQAEETRIDKLLHSAQDNPPAAPEKDEELGKLTEQLTSLQAEYKALQTKQSEQAAVARGEIDSAMDAFQKQIEAARGQGAESPELINYIAAAENLQKTARELLGEMLDRQQKQYQQLSQLKATLDEKAQQRAIELRNSDPQLKDFYEKRELYRRQVNAGLGSGVDKRDVEAVEDQLKLTENMIKSREELLSSDPLHVETITSLQAMIDKMQSDIGTDRKKADDKMEELQKSFAASSPAVANLPEEQKKLAEQVREQLGSITMARKRYADILEADRVAAEQKLKEMQGKIVALQGDVESRKQLLGDEFASKSVTALTAALESQRKLLAEAQTQESVARAEFEAKGKELRTARDTLAALQNGDERMARLISDRETTEGLVATFGRDLQFRQEEAKRLIDIQAPPVDGVKEFEGKDPKPIYYLIALVSILALTAASVLWTLHSANRMEFASVARDPGDQPAAPPAPKPVDSNGSEDTPAAIA